MACAQQSAFPGRFELFGCIGAYRPEHPVREWCGCRVDGYQRFSDEPGQKVGALHIGQPVVAGDNLRHFQRERSWEHGHPSQHNLLGGRQQRMAPIECRFERAMPGSSRSRDAVRQAEGFFEFFGQCLQPESGRQCADHLDRQRQPVESATNADRRPRRSVGELEPQIRGLNTVDEQGDGGWSQRQGRGPHIVARDRQRRQTIDLLATAGERLSAGCEQADSRSLCQYELRKGGHGIDDLLAIIEQDQQMLLSQPIRQLFGRSAALQLDAERRRYKTWNQRGLLQRRKIDEEVAVAIVGSDRADNFETEAGLADPTGTRERHQASPGKEGLNSGQIGLAAKEPIERQRRGWRRRGGYGADKAVAEPGRRLDPVRVCAQGFAQRWYMNLDIVFLDDGVGPDPVHQFALRDEVAFRLDQDRQDVERSRADWNCNAIQE
jgi:hypothetical protein